MKIDSSLLIENPWAVAGICYLILFGFLAGLILIGSLVANLLGVSKRDTYGLFVRMLIGLTGSTLLYALIHSGGQTVLLPIVFFGFAAYLVERKNQPRVGLGFSNWINRRQVLFILGSATLMSFLFLTLLLDFKTGDLRFLGSTVSPQYIDFPFTVRLSQFLNYAGIESLTADFFELEGLRAQPYHWLEIWFSALVFNLFKVNGEVLCVFGWFSRNG